MILAHRFKADPLLDRSAGRVSDDRRAIAVGFTDNSTYALSSVALLEGLSDSSISAQSLCCKFAVGFCDALCCAVLSSEK